MRLTLISLVDAKLAALAPNPVKGTPATADLPPLELTKPNGKRITPFQHVAAQCYAKGWLRASIAHACMRKFYPAEQHSSKLLGRIRLRLGQLEKAQFFRDYIWELTVQQLDLDAPDIVRGVTAVAKRGKVDAAKFSLELAGRYQPKQDQNITAVQIVMGDGVDRPALPARAHADVIIEEDTDN